MSLTLAERITRLETKVEQVEKTLSDMDDKLDSIHDAFTQAKGAKWLIVAAASVMTILATQLPSLFNWLSSIR